jgi:hypothetical protein
MARHSVSQQQLFALIHEREFRSTRQALGACVAAGLGEGQLRTMALTLVRHECLIRDVIEGPSDKSGARAPAPAWGGELLAAYERAHRETSDSLARLTNDQWEEMIEGPANMLFWPAVRRGELMWMALRDLVEQVERLIERVPELGRGVPEAHDLSA